MPVNQASKCTLNGVFSGSGIATLIGVTVWTSNPKWGWCQLKCIQMDKGNHVDGGFLFPQTEKKNPLNNDNQRLKKRPL